MPDPSRNPPQSRRLARSAPVVAIVGATGAVGRELLGVLQRRHFPLAELRLYASPRSAGTQLAFRGEDVTIAALSGDSFAGVDLALFSAGSQTAREFAPAATRAGAIVIDNSSAFRMDAAVPLIVPEINGAELARHDGIVANPNCAAIIALMALWPIQQRNPIRRVMLATYQAASGAGAARDGRIAGGDPRRARRKPLPAARAALSLRLQPVQPRHADRPGDRLQRRRDESHERDAQDSRHARAAHQRHLHPRADVARRMRSR